MTASSSQPRTPSEEIAGLVERVTFFNEERGFSVLRVKVRGQRELVTVLGSLPSVSAGEWLTAEGWWVRDKEHGLQFKAYAVTIHKSQGSEFPAVVIPFPLRKLRSGSNGSLRLCLASHFHGDSLLSRSSPWDNAARGGSLRGWRCGGIACFFLRGFPGFGPTCLLRGCDLRTCLSAQGPHCFGGAGQRWTAWFPLPCRSGAGQYRPRLLQSRDLGVNF